MRVNKSKWRIAGIAAAVALVVPLGFFVRSAVAPVPPGSGVESFGASTGADWPTWQKDLSGSRYNAAESKITPATVAGLKLKWAYTYPDVPFARMGSQPAVTDGVLYVGGPDGKFRALDAKSGATRWTYDLTPVAGPWTDQNPNLIRDGAAVSGDLVYFGDSRGFVYGLDKRTGAKRWATRVDEHAATWMSSSPMVLDGKVYIGVSSNEAGSANLPTYACCSFSGHVEALDARTGSVVWNLPLLPPAKRIGTWPTGAPKYGPAGAAVWSSPVIDAETRTLYVGTGNAHTGTGAEEMENIDSVLAVDLDRGTIRWKRQMQYDDVHNQSCTWPDPAEYCPSHYNGNAKNFDFGATGNLYKINGRKVLGIAQKAGVFWAMDARTGETIWHTQLSTPDMAHEDPGSAGTPWGSSFDGKHIYVATWRGNPATLYSLDARTGRVEWKTTHPADGCGTGGAAKFADLCERAFPSAVSTTPGLVYEGSADGKMRIFSAADGRLLWQFDAVRDFQGVNGVTGMGRAIGANGGAVVVNGMLYVQAGYYPFYPSDGKGTVLLAFGL
ncbi:PQQ-binding-like beta-propeller repeat protein [Amycolatopsis sp. NBC_00345]|uniref:outer membrane protein assembly factor BamB family protein n=1 Tax=Amycolatopsis sp. NBC_00345 TaxID=2975955 RepID=UPI002E264B8E